MKALLTDNKRKLWLADIAPPPLDDYDCLVHVEACAFCHSTDRHIVQGTFLSSFHNPSVLGHESVGVVVQAGAKVRSLQLGDRVLRAYALYPGEVHEGIGSAWGAFAQFGKVKDWRAMVQDGALSEDAVPGVFKYMQQVPADIPLEKSLLMITQKEILSACAQIDPVAGHSFLIAGAGITACMFGLFLKLRGAARVTMAARRPEPLEFALHNGVVDDVCLIDDVASPKRDYDGLVETTGSIQAARKLAERALGDGGAIYSYAVYEGMAAEGFFAPLSERWRFARINPAEASAHDEVVAMLRSG